MFSLSAVRPRRTSKFLDLMHRRCSPSSGYNNLGIGTISSDGAFRRVYRSSSTTQLYTRGRRTNFNGRSASVGIAVAKSPCCSGATNVTVQAWPPPMLLSCAAHPPKSQALATPWRRAIWCVDAERWCYVLQLLARRVLVPTISQHQVRKAETGHGIGFNENITQGCFCATIFCKISIWYK